MYAKKLNFTTLLELAAEGEKFEFAEVSDFCVEAMQKPLLAQLSNHTEKIRHTKKPRLGFFESQK
jgi:hypothetical protein